MTIASVSAAGSLPGSAPISAQQLIEPLTQLIQSIEQLVAALQQQAPANVPATPAVDAATAGGGAATDAATSGGGGGCGCGGMQATAGAEQISQSGSGSSSGANAAPTAGPKAKKQKSGGGGNDPKPGGGQPAGNQGASTAGAAPATPTSGTPIDAGIKRKNPRSVAEMMDWVRKEVNNPHEDYYRKCGHFSAAAYGWKASGENLAIDQWNHAAEKHPGDTNPPAGALVFWKTGSPAGHVAVSMGNGMVASNDILRKGKIDIVPLSKITNDWHASYQGWTPPYFPKAA